MVKKIYKKKHNKTHRKLRMRGGEFTENEINELGVLGFNAQQIHTLEQLQNEIPIIINLVRQSTQQVNPTTNNLFTPQEIMDTLAEIPQDPGEIHDFLDESFGSFDENNDSINNTTQESLSDISFGNAGSKNFLVLNTAMIEGIPKMMAVFRLTKPCLYLGQAPTRLLAPTINKE